MILGTPPPRGRWLAGDRDEEDAMNEQRPYANTDEQPQGGYSNDDRNIRDQQRRDQADGERRMRQDGDGRRDPDPHSDPLNP